MWRLAGSMLFNLVLASNSWGQSGPLQLIVAFPAGSGTDISARIFADSLQQTIGRPVVVMNRGGASGTIGSRAVAGASPDGNSLGFLTSMPITLQSHVMKLNIRPEDFTPICRVSEFPTSLVASPKSGLLTLEAAIEAAKSRPGALNLGIAGLYSGPHLAAMRFLEVANVNMLVVPHQGDNNAIQPLLTGELDLAFAQPQFGPANGFRVLAVSSKERTPLLPDVPTFSEMGLPIVNTVSAGLVGPKNLPPELASALDAACKSIATSAVFEERMTKIGIAISYAPSTVYARQLTEDWQSMRAFGESVPVK